VLLVGYAYTHTLSASAGRRRQLLVQGTLLLLPFLVLPFALKSWTPPTESNPIFAVLWLLLGMVGLPFFVVSTSAPLLQKWFGHTGHPAAKDPYFLYGASNLGSMLALLAYPLVVEPNFGVDAQVRLWTGLYVGFVLLTLGCALLIWRSSATEAKVAVLQSAEPLLVGAAAPSATSGSHARPLVLPHHLDFPTSLEGSTHYAESERLTLGRRLRWVALTAVPSSLMLGVTTYMTTDIAAVPFFWVTPLALYLLTFILVFARWPVVWTEAPHTLLLYLQPCLVLLLALKMLANLTPRHWGTLVDALLHLSAFFVTALVCHGELAKDRPRPRHLTEFYLWMSLGGMLGGLFNAFFAPLVFQHGIFEYPLAMVFAYLLRPDLVGPTALVPGDAVTDRPTLLGRVFDIAVPVLLALATWGAIYLIEETNYTPDFLQRSLVIAAAVVAVFMLSSRPLRCGLALAGLFLAVTVYDRYMTETLVYEGRGFFGLLRVRKVTERRDFDPCFAPTAFVGLGTAPWAQLVGLHARPLYDDLVEGRISHTLIHGGIDHGRQIVEPRYLRNQPVTYFHPSNGIGEVFQKFSWSSARFPASLVGLGMCPGTLLVGLHSEPPYAVIGLGTGTLAVHARPYQTTHFYEIDPLVRGLSLPGPNAQPVFYFLRDALERGANLDVIMGDGRLQIAKAPAKYYHIITLDAFSSDAIPVHLLTKEALQLYLEKLADGGLLIFNATNRYVDIQGVLAALAQELDLDCLYCGDFGNAAIPDKYPADWIVMARKGEHFANGGPPLRARLDGTRWQAKEPLPGPVWTDNYSNLFRVLHLR
jgi:hypothetical protein